MRADYATSDLISKVNSEWIHEMLADLVRADPGDDAPRDHVSGGQVSAEQVSAVDVGGDHVGDGHVPEDEFLGEDVLGEDVLGHDVLGHDVPRHDVLRHDIAGDIPVNEMIASDLSLRREFARKRSVLQRGATRLDGRTPDIAIGPMARRSRHRSVARRVKERLAFAVAALVMVGAGAWMTPEPQDITNSVPPRAVSAAPEPAAPMDSAAPMDTAALQPTWLVPEILYGFRDGPHPHGGR